jgi:hypothetical protein
MKRKLLTGMIASAIILIVSSFLLMSYTTKKLTEDFWKQLGISESDGKKNIFYGFLQGGVNTFYAKNAKNIVLGNRAAVTTNLLNYTKKYIATPAFQKEYEKFRTDAKPQPPEPMKTKESIREKYIKDAELGISNIEKVIAATADVKVKKALGEQIPVQKKQLEDYKSPNSKMIEAAWQGEQNIFKRKNEQYLKSVKEWETAFPEKSVQLLKPLLEKFLEVTKGIDYNAVLTEQNGKRYFVNREYETKNYQWKMGFRAGKEVTETARTFVQQWLKELR